MSTTIPKPHLKLATRPAEGIATPSVGETAEHDAQEQERPFESLKARLARGAQADLVANADLRGYRLQLYSVNQSCQAWRDIAIWATSEEEAKRRALSDEFYYVWMEDFDYIFVPELHTIRAEGADLVREWNEKTDDDPPGFLNGYRLKKSDAQ